MNYIAPWHCWSIHVATLVHSYLALGHIRYQAFLPWTFKPLKPGFLQVAQPFKLPLHLMQPYGPLPLEVALALAFGFFSLLAPLALSVLATLAVLAALAAAALFIFWGCCFSNIALKACWFHRSSVLVAFPFLFLAASWFRLSGACTGTIASDGAATWGVACWLWDAACWLCRDKAWPLGC